VPTKDKLYLFFDDGGRTVPTKDELYLFLNFLDYSSETSPISYIV
jgi:hypothetical protein